MNQRQALERWWGAAALGVIVLLFLAVGFCCLEQDGIHHHGVPMDLCSMAILILVVSVSVEAPVLFGLAPTLGRPWSASILLAVPKPPPRPIRLS